VNGKSSLTFQGMCIATGLPPYILFKIAHEAIEESYRLDHAPNYYHRYGHLFFIILILHKPASYIVSLN
jgi:hypothetical protein